MITKKANGKIFGASLTVAERKAMELEIKRQIAEYDKKHERDLEATALWVLHDIFGFGKDRLKKFYDSYSDSIEALAKHYEMDQDDQAWLCEEKLREFGVDLDIWEQEKKGE